MATPEGEPLDLFAEVPESGFDDSSDPDPVAADPVPGGQLPGTPGVTPPERIWTVTEINRTVRGLLESELPELWIAGEVANFTRARSGHLYFTLKDEGSQLRCVMWRRDAARLPIDPEEGMEIRVRGSLTLYEARGEFQLSVRQVEAHGEEGLWKLAFERLRARLEEEGLLDPARRRPIPRFPQAVGVVTSPTGAAFRDILTVIRRRAPWTRVVLLGTRVQGEGAAAEIARAIEVLAGSGEVDVLIVGRGGGSIEDLWAFNEEPVARAISESPVPVISAVGHEVDVTISDLVADLRAPTPSAGAEAAVQDGRALQRLLEGVRARLSRGLRHQAERRRHRLATAELRLVRGIRGTIDPVRASLERREQRMTQSVRRLIEVRRHALGSIAGKVEALSPLATLQRGYSLALGGGGRVLRRAGDFREVETFDLRVVDGRVRCDVVKVDEEVG